MKLEDTLYEAPEMSEEKFQEEVEKLIDIAALPYSPAYTLFRDKNWTAQELIKEWELINNKESKLSRMKRDIINGIVSLALINMTKDKEE